MKTIDFLTKNSIINLIYQKEEILNETEAYDVPTYKFGLMFPREKTEETYDENYKKVFRCFFERLQDENYEKTLSRIKLLESIKKNQDQVINLFV